MTPYSRQYMSIVFYHDDKQEEISQEMKKHAGAARNKTVHTEIRPYDAFYMAENYHQKYYLQLNKDIMADFNALYPDFKGFIYSTDAARINGYVKGLGDMNSLLEEIDAYGLSERGRKRLIEIVEGYGR